MTKEVPEEIRKYMSELGKRSHKKSPRPKEYYSRISNIRWAKVETKDKKKEEEK